MNRIVMTKVEESTVHVYSPDRTLQELRETRKTKTFYTNESKVHRAQFVHIPQDEQSEHDESEEEDVDYSDIEIEDSPQSSITSQRLKLILEDGIEHFSSEVVENMLVDLRRCTQDMTREEFQKIGLDFMCQRIDELLNVNMELFKLYVHLYQCPNTVDVIAVMYILKLERSDPGFEKFEQCFVPWLKMITRFADCNSCN